MTYNERKEAVRVIRKMLGEAFEPYLYASDISGSKENIREIAYRILSQIRNEFNVFVMVPQIMFTESESGSWKVWFRYDGFEISLFEWVSMLDGDNLENI